MGAGRAAEIDSLKTAIQNTLGNRRTADEHLILTYESDQEILYDGDARPWKFSYLDT